MHPIKALTPVSLTAPLVTASARDSLRVELGWILWLKQKWNINSNNNTALFKQEQPQYTHP